jgi:hypothetical protein
MKPKTPLRFNLSHKPKGVAKSQSGQVIIEYVLLLVIIVGLSSLIVTQMASRNEDSPGFLIRQWNEIIKQIAADDPGQY